MVIIATIDTPDAAFPESSEYSSWLPHFISAAGLDEKEKSWEWKDLQAAAFAPCLAEGLRGVAAEHPADEDTEVVIGELGTDVMREARWVTKGDQRPKHGFPRDHLGLRNK
jgi:hypothetical protein